jgi:predicted HTH domain antitoxin
MIAEALNMEKLFMADRDQRLAYILDWKQMMDESNRDAKFRESEDKRRELEEKLSLAANKLLAEGVSPEIAAKALGLSLEEVRHLVK